jgi:class 3 adenylate cyclase
VRANAGPTRFPSTDIAGSTAVAERVDPEEGREVVSGAHRRVSEAIALWGYEGTIAQLLGDGVLAFFTAGAGRLDFAIGDVAGKGMPAALFTALTCALLRGEVRRIASPERVLQNVNRRRG